MEADEDREEVFTVEIHRGPHGLGLALVDGMVRRDRLLHDTESVFTESRTGSYGFYLNEKQRSTFQSTQPLSVPHGSSGPNDIHIYVFFSHSCRKRR